MATKLTPEKMKQQVRDHLEDFVNHRKAEVIHANMTSDFYDHDGPGGKPTNATGDEEMMLGMYKAMPDLHLTIEDMVAEGDKSRLPQCLALDRSTLWQENAIPRFCHVALRGR